VEGSPLTVSGNLTLNSTVFEVFIPAGSSPLGLGTNALINYSGTLAGSPNSNAIITGGSIASGGRAVIVVDKSGKHVNLTVQALPVANAVSYSRTPGVSLMIYIADLLTNATDANGYTLTLAGVGTDGYNLATATGSTLATNSTSILYTNSTPANVSDSFKYVVSDGSGGLATNTVTINVVAATGQQTPGALSVDGSGNVHLTFYGYPGAQYYIQRSATLSPPSWTDVSGGPFTANFTTGIITATDTPGTPSAYYQLSTSP
jgi:hypothetical protein